MDKQQKKQFKRYIAWLCLAALVAVLTAMPLLAGRKAEEDGPQASILTTALTQRDIDVRIIGGGQLASETTEEITVPEAVKLTKYLVKNGDTVKKGDPIARVDKVSVMLAISGVQETLDYLAGQIASASTDKESDRINAQTAGEVKAVYGKAGDSVRDVMLTSGALAVLSLDGKMAVDIACDSDLTYGKTVSVTLSNGKTVKGTVESNISGTLTVTVTDKKYAVGQAVTVSTEDGDEIGSGELYIHNPWNATAYYGTIKRVNVKPGDKVSAGRALFQLEVGDHSTQFQMLNTQRQEYEALMQELFEMHSTGLLTAPCDGFVTGVDTDGAFLLAANSEEQSWFIQPLSHSTADSGWKIQLLSSTNNTLPDFSGIGTLPDFPGIGQITPPSQILPGVEQSPTPPGAEEENPDVELAPVCTKEAECQGLVHELGCPKAVYTVRVAQVLPTGNVATNPGSYPNVTLATLAAVPRTVALGGNVENWPTTGLLNMDLVTEYGGIAGSGAILFELCTVLGETHYVYAGSVSAGGETPGTGTPGTSTPGTGTPETTPGGMGSMGNMGGLGGFAGFGGFGGFGGGYSSVPAFEPYSLETLTVASVTSQERMTLEISVDEQDITKLYTGQEATVTVEALTGQTFPAVITSVSNTGTNGGGSSKFTAELTLSQTGEMLPGMHASAFLSLQSQSAAVIPVAALVEDGGQTVVYTGYDEKKETLTGPVTVTTGVSDGEYVQILSGLTEADTVYYAYYDTLEYSKVPERGLGF